MPYNLSSYDLLHHNFDLTFASLRQISKFNLRLQLVTNVTKKVVAAIATSKAWPEWLYMLGPGPAKVKIIFNFCRIFFY